MLPIVWENADSPGSAVGHAGAGWPQGGMYVSRGSGQQTRQPG